MGPGVLVTEGRGVQAGVQHPPRAGVSAVDLGRQADRGAGAVAHDIGG